MAYRADGLRVEKQNSSGTTRFIWDGANILRETDAADATSASTPCNRSCMGTWSAQRRAGASRFYHFDALGSTRHLSDASQSITDSYAYHAYGALAASTGGTANPFRWVGLLGYYYDPDRLAYYIRARHYAPILARWLSQDPISADINPYRYVGNRSVTWRDPLGFAPLSSSLLLSFLVASEHGSTSLAATLTSISSPMRREAGQPGTSRLFSEGSVESKKIGTASASDVTVTTDTGWSYRKFYRVMHDEWIVESAKATPHGPEPSVQSRKIPYCQTFVGIEAWANYPFLTWVAPLPYTITWPLFLPWSRTTTFVLTFRQSTPPSRILRVVLTTSSRMLSRLRTLARPTGTYGGNERPIRQRRFSTQRRLRAARL